ncbi:MAG: tetratricopeptide repeat protein [Flavipsychrobacter sp.]|nr:tetratricopeptide repeat protein [Flavipsychrobacter sp.]
MGYYLIQMAKNINKKPVQAASTAQQNVADNEPTVMNPMIPAWLYDFKIQAIIVAVLSFVFYINTVANESAHDDLIVIVQNEYALEGFAGIPEIFTKDAYDSYYRQYNSSNQLAGGRYRPLSILTFAIEQQFFGAIPKDKIDSFFNHSITFGVKDPHEKVLIHDMHIRHFFNVLWFTLSVVVLLYFLRYIVFRKNYIMALIATIIFAIHPIHTEVVANVKSRDEIMSVLFICLTFIYAFKYREIGKKWMLWVSLLSFLLAFLSKEYAITLIVLLPLSFYIFDHRSLQRSLLATLPYFAVVGVYVIMRLQVVQPMNAESNNEILNNPYAFAVGNQKIATEISTSLNYLSLLVFPHPLSADYSYNQIPYKDFSHPQVWLSFLVHGILIWAFFYYYKRRSVICFAIAFYLLNLAMICNIIFDIGATMGERLIYHSSVGFAIALAYFLYKGMEKIKPESVGRASLAGFMVIIIVLCGFKTIERNADWKNDLTLFSADIKVASNSVMVNANVAAALIDKADFEKTEALKKADMEEAIKLLNKSIELHKTYVIAYLNKGLVYFKMGIPDSVMTSLDMARSLYPNHPKLPEMYYNTGVSFYMQKRYPEAIKAWQNTLKVNPEYAQAKQAIAVLNKAMQEAPLPTPSQAPAPPPSVAPSQQPQ